MPSWRMSEAVSMSPQCSQISPSSVNRQKSALWTRKGLPVAGMPMNSPWWVPLTVVKALTRLLPATISSVVNRRSGNAPISRGVQVVAVHHLVVEPLQGRGVALGIHGMPAVSVRLCCHRLRPWVGARVLAGHRLGKPVQVVRPPGGAVLLVCRRHAPVDQPDEGAVPVRGEGDLHHPGLGTGRGIALPRPGEHHPVGGIDLDVGTDRHVPPSGHVHPEGAARYRVGLRGDRLPGRQLLRLGEVREHVARSGVHVHLADDRILCGTGHDRRRASVSAERLICARLWSQKLATNACTSASRSGRARYSLRVPSRRSVTSPASRSTRRCLEMFGRATSKCAATSPAVHSCAQTRRKISCRRGSAMARSTASTTEQCICVVTYPSSYLRCSCWCSAPRHRCVP